MNPLIRLGRNLFAERFARRRWFPPAELDRISAAVEHGERAHAGEICVAIESRLDPIDVVMGLSPRARAEQLFAQLRVWDTEQNSGVLVYVLLAEHCVEIVADRGIAARVPPAEWKALCERVAAGFAARDPMPALLDAIERLHALMQAHLPAASGNPREIADRPIVL